MDRLLRPGGGLASLGQKMSEGYDSDEDFELVQKGLFVEPPTRSIDLDTVPLDGNEFIMKSKLEESSLTWDRIEDLSVGIPEEKVQKCVRKHAKTNAEEFSELAQKLTKEREFLKKKFPRKVEIPEGGIKEWCHFCLGSKLYAKIYAEKPSKEVGHPPVLSIIVHLSQDQVIMVLRYLYYWFLSLGMERTLGMWVFSLLACLNKPLDKRSEKLIKLFYKACKIRQLGYDACEMPALYIISEILEYHFCLNSDKVK